MEKSPPPHFLACPIAGLRHAFSPLCLTLAADCMHMQIRPQIRGPKA